MLWFFKSVLLAPHVKCTASVAIKEAASLKQQPIPSSFGSCNAKVSGGGSQLSRPACQHHQVEKRWPQPPEMISCLAVLDTDVDVLRHVMQDDTTVRADRAAALNGWFLGM